MQIVLHVGMHKTGTSSFQNWLRVSYGNLLDRGVAVFPLDARVLANIPNCFDPVSLRETLVELERSRIHTVVFSHETLSECFTSDLSKLCNIFYPHPVRYVITIRHWNGFLLSRWQQNCSRRDAQSYVSFLEELWLNPEGRIEAFYDLPVRRAIEVGITDIHVVSFDLELQNNTLLQTLAETCLLPVEFMPSPIGQPKMNVSMASRHSDRTRMFNGIISEAGNRVFNPMAVRSCTGLAPDVFYDLGQATVIILTRSKDMSTRLDHELSKRTESARLNSRQIEEVQTRITDFLGPFFRNTQKKRVFLNPEDRQEKVSGLEFSELPRDLRLEMREALQIERPELF